MIRREVNRAVNKKIELKIRQYAHTAVGSAISGVGTSDYSSVSYGGTSIVSALAGGIANGTGEGQRVGGQITLKGVQVNFALQPGDNTNYLRIMLVSPKRQADLSSVANFVQQILGNTASSGTQWLGTIDTDLYTVHFNKRYFMSFRPLDGSSATALPYSKFLNKFIRFNKKVKWALNNPVIPINDVYLVAISDSAAITNPGAVAGFVKLWYQDA